MTKTTLKKNIHKAIDNINDDAVLQAVYTLLNRVSTDDFDWTDEDLRIVEERRAAYLSGKEKTISISEAKKRLKRKFGK
jgi:hypothetical protein